MSGSEATNGQEATSVEALVEQNRVLARRLARRFSRGEVVDPDLEQVAVTGLFLAASRYESPTGPFRPFAMVTIIGELKKHLRSQGWAVRVPRRLQEASITVADASERLAHSLGRSATPQEVADDTGLSIDEVLLAVAVARARFSAGEIDEGSGGSAARSDCFAGRSDTTIDVRSVTGRLDPDDRALIDLRFYHCLTQRQIADRLGMSQSQVHRRIDRVLTSLRGGLDGYDDGAGRGRAP